MTAAAHRLLRIVHVSQMHFRQLQAPYERGANAGVYFAPRNCLIYFLELRQAALGLERSFTERLRWELAGLASPRGIRAGVGTFPSAHEILVEASRVVIANVGILLINKASIERLDEHFDWDKGLRSIPEGITETFTEHWQGERHGYFLALIWNIVETIRFLQVLQLRGIIDCEHSLARRGRNVGFEQGGFPRSHLTRLELRADQQSRFTGEVSWSPSSRPNVVRFVAAAAKLAKLRSTRDPLSLSGIYRAANLVGNSQTRAKDAALRLALVNSQWRVTALGSRLLAEEAQVKL